VFVDASQKLAVMSIGFLLQNRDDAVVWRGPKKNGTELLVPVLVVTFGHVFCMTNSIYWSIFPSACPI
jgi:hypothetical protein